MNKAKYQARAIHTALALPCVPWLLHSLSSSILPLQIKTLLSLFATVLHPQSSQGSIVVVKSMTQDELGEEFKREVEMLSRLSHHPNIVIMIVRRFGDATAAATAAAACAFLMRDRGHAWSPGALSWSLWSAAASSTSSAYASFQIAIFVSSMCVCVWLWYLFSLCPSLSVIYAEDAGPTEHDAHTAHSVGGVRRNGLHPRTEAAHPPQRPQVRQRARHQAL